MKYFRQYAVFYSYGISKEFIFYLGSYFSEKKIKCMRF